MVISFRSRRFEHPDHFSRAERLRSSELDDHVPGRNCGGSNKWRRKGLPAAAPAITRRQRDRAMPVSVSTMLASASRKETGDEINSGRRACCPPSYSREARRPIRKSISLGLWRSGPVDEVDALPI